MDHCLNWRLKRLLPGHIVQATFELGWDTFRNGRLLTLAETQFDVFLTVDKGIKYQQNFIGRNIAVITLRGRNNRIETHIPLMPQVLALLPIVQPGLVYFVEAKPEASEPDY
ncbi:MAG: hypothetical protein ACRYFS_09010 [Janthinobacterium lividum]